MAEILIRLGCEEDLKVIVREIQSALSLKADGIFGKQTDKFLRDFQAANGLVTDGIAGTKTLDKLRDVAKQGKLPDYINTTVDSNGKWQFSQRSLDRMKGVHANLVKVFMAAIATSPFDFAITEGVRTVEQQKIYYAQGKSKTMKSRHIPSSNVSGLGEAMDIVVYVNGKVNWDFDNYRLVANHIKAVAQNLGIPITWGGDWATLRDGPHFELKR